MSSKSYLSTMLAVFLTVATVACSFAQSRLTTRGADIIDSATGERVILQGFGIGVWLLPEGYMWGIRTLDRPRQFEAAIEDLIGRDDATEFWRLYHENFFTAEDVVAIKAMGANSIRIALLASKLQPREGQPDAPPFNYSDEGFRFLDSVMVWADRYDIGVIWDMHGAPGAQNAENIADSDGEPRLWTEPEKYWPLLTDLWLNIARRYAGNPHVIGYDLLNEPLLGRYEGVNPGLLRELYVLLTDSIRTVDPHGLIFVEGDDWAQDFSILEPIDWDPHLVLAFHSYPPTKNQAGLQRWDDLRRRYNVPLWHGETGEQSPPYDHNREATAFLNSANVGWSWWTHKKLERWTQPWLCQKTKGFQAILDYWMGRAERPSREEARAWLYEMAERTNSKYCTFLSDLVSSLEPLSPDPYLQSRRHEPPSIFEQPDGSTVEIGSNAYVFVRALGFPLEYEWSRNDEVVENERGPFLNFVPMQVRDDGERVSVRIFNELGEVESREVVVRTVPFTGPQIGMAGAAPTIDGVAEEAWQDATVLTLNNVVVQRSDKPSEADLSASARLLWDEMALYVFVDVKDDARIANAPDSYNSDGIEFYIDVHGDKTINYGPDDHQIRINRGFSETVSDDASPASGIRSAQVEAEDGYRVEVAIPFSALSDKPRESDFVGFDIHVNDSDKDNRENKIAWHGTRDNAYQSPARFGTLLLSRE